MYKEIRIVYSDAARNEILKIFKEEKIEKYINLEQVQAMWSKNIRHMGTHIWPGTDSIFILLLEKEKAEQLLKKLKEMKKKLIEGVDMFVTVTPVEEIF
ncbi:hypothetical protein EV215_1432 [Hypnocyclicus thermotrophus]|uniref:Uncharacterized protein n=1 Tax=Hypnocyclicus thermotrophus TaxID=1627895 RepID=A0AA46DYK9_9FUSO|nr:PG0541 family transporter-associated protein [Hypnocyclicus thermotrophus]TDT69889.1 hypothetical protein EV215_1432 [Hypnocyclicus thermotrophus]